MFLTLDGIADSIATSMTSKYDGRCKKCGVYFPAGADIKWMKTIGAFHIECYEKYTKLESGLVDVLTLLLKSPSRAKQKLIQTLTHADSNTLYHATKKLVAANDYENVIEMLNNIPESEIDWYLQIVLASAYFSQGKKKYAEDAIDKSIEILSEHKSTLAEEDEWSLQEYIIGLQTLDKEKVLSLAELILAIKPNSIAMKQTKANLSPTKEALSMDNELLEDAVAQYAKEGTLIRLFVACEWKYARLVGFKNSNMLSRQSKFTAEHVAKATSDDERRKIRQIAGQQAIVLAERFASQYDPELLLPVLRVWFENASKDKFFEKCDKIDKERPSALFNFYLASMIAHLAKRPLLIQKYCLEIMDIVGPTNYDEIFEIKHADTVMLSGQSELYIIIAHQMHMNALLDGDRKYQALETFFTRLGDFENGVTWKELDYKSELLDKLLDAWLEYHHKWKGPMPLWFGSDRMQKCSSMELFCEAILEKFPNNNFALTKLGKPLPEKSTSTKGGVEITDKSFEDVGKYPKPEGQKLELKYSYFLPDADKLKFTQGKPFSQLSDAEKEAAQKAIDGNEKSIQEEVSSTIAAFMNTNEGKLILGIADDRRLVGIDDEVKKCGSPDKYLIKIKNNLKTHLNNYPGLFSEYVSLDFIEDKGSKKTFFEINVKPVPKKNNLVYCKAGKDRKVYVREADGDQSKKVEDLEAFIVSRRENDDST